MKWLDSGFTFAALKYTSSDFASVCELLPPIILILLAVALPKTPLPFYEDWDIKFFLFLLGFMLWGVVFAGNPIVETILADSVPTGEILNNSFLLVQLWELSLFIVYLSSPHL